MKKKLAIELMCVLGLSAFVTNCSDETSSGVKDPSQVEAEFSSPSGSVTDDNATETINRAIRGWVPLVTLVQLEFNTTVLDDPDAATYTDCFTNPTSRMNTTMDISCLADLGGFGVRDDDTGSLITACSGSGSVSFATTSEQLQSQLDEVSVDCDFTLTPFSGMAGEYRNTLVEVNDAWEYSCMDVRYSVDDRDLSFNGCWHSWGDILIDTGNGSAVMKADYVTTPRIISDNCQSLCANITDQDGDAQVICDVKRMYQACVSGSDMDADNAFRVEEVENCVVTRNASCS